LKDYKRLGLLAVIGFCLFGLGWLQIHPETPKEVVWPQDAERHILVFEVSAETPFAVEVTPPKDAIQLELFLNLTQGPVKWPPEVFVWVNGRFYYAHDKMETLAKTFFHSFLAFEGAPIPVERLEIRVFAGMWTGWMYLHEKNGV